MKKELTIHLATKTSNQPRAESYYFTSTTPNPRGKQQEHFMCLWICWGSPVIPSVSYLGEGADSSRWGSADWPPQV